MSSIGSAGLTALNLAGSVAGTQRTGTDADRVRQNAAAQKAARDLSSLSSQALDDVAETEHSPERDADGRMPWSADDFNPGSDGETADAPYLMRPRATDPHGYSGINLDLDA